MALIKCPECGHDVSDSARACMNCGYDVYSHFYRIKLHKEDEIRIAKEKEERKKEREEQNKFNQSIVQNLSVLHGSIIGEANGLLEVCEYVNNTLYVTLIKRFRDSFFVEGCYTAGIRDSGYGTKQVYYVDKSQRTHLIDLTKFRTDPKLYDIPKHKYPK